MTTDSITSKYLISTSVKGDQCGNCHRDILTAMVNGFFVRVEALTIDAIQEVTYRLGGLDIFQGIGSGNTLELQKRSIWHITHSPSTTAVFARHACSIPPLGNPLSGESVKIDSQEVPF